MILSSPARPPRLLRFCALLLAWALLWKSAASANAATVVLDAVDFAVVPAAAEMTPQALAR